MLRGVFFPLCCCSHHLSALKSLLELILQAMHDSRKVSISSSEGDDQPISRYSEVLHLSLAASSLQSSECRQARRCDCRCAIASCAKHSPRTLALRPANTASWFQSRYSAKMPVLTVREVLQSCPCGALKGA